jgi:ketopantoate reductase
VNFVIAGAGAIGGYIGARLARAGADVLLFARGPHLRAMQTGGLRVTSDEGNFEVRPQLIDNLATVGKADVVFVGVKAHSLTALAPQLGVFGADTVVVSTQNGIPWWYFQATPTPSSTGCGSSASIRGRHRCVDRAASDRRFAGVFRDRCRRARRDPSHRGQSHQLRRAGLHEIRARQGDR